MRQRKIRVEFGPYTVRGIAFERGNQYSILLEDYDIRYTYYPTGVYSNLICSEVIE